MNEILEQYQNIIAIALAILSLLFGARTVLSKILNKIITSSIRWIKELETEYTLTGPEKMELLVSYVKDLIPRILHVIFSDKVIESIAESVFEDMQKYSENRVKNKTGLSWREMLKAIGTTESIGVYTFKDGTTMKYISKYEKEFFEYMDSQGMVPEEER